MQPLCLSATPPQCSQQWRWGEGGGGNKSVFSLKVSQCQARQNIYQLWLLNSGDLGSRDSSVVWAPDSWLKGCVWIPAGVAGVSNLAFYAQSTSAVISGWMELQQFLLQSQLSVLTLILVLIPPSHVTAVAHKKDPGRSAEKCKVAGYGYTGMHLRYVALHEVTWCLVVWCTQNTLRQQQFHVAPAMPVLKYTTLVDIQKCTTKS